jgi:selenocysteine-specific elongation factor
VSESGASISRPDWAPKLTAEQESTADAYVASLVASPYAPPTDGAPPPDVLDYLRDAGRVVVLGSITFANEAYEEMVARVTEHLRSEGTVTLAQVRDMFGTSRKYAQALLEHLDQERVTRRVGDERVLRGS